jgi:hypothetical protein
MAFTSREQDCANVIKQVQASVAIADRSYRKGGSLDALNAANGKLANAHNEMYEAAGGVIPDKR